MTIQNVVSDNKTLSLPYPASLAVNRGDLLYWDSVAKQVKPLTSKTTLASEILDQADVASKFLGVSWDTRNSTETDNNAFRVVQTEGIFDCDCPSQILYPGDLVGATWNGGTALVNQNVTKVANQALAIGVVVNGYGKALQLNGSAVTTVRVRLFSHLAWDVLYGKPAVGDLQGTGATVLSDGNQTLTIASSPILSMVPTAPRNITLPVEAQSAGLVYYFTNNSGGANTVTFLGSGGGSVKGNGACPQNKTAYVWCDGTNWNGLISA